MTIWNPHARLLTITEAAASIDRPTSTVRRWISEGRLQPHAFRWANHRNQDLYLEADVLLAEATTRRHRHQHTNDG